MSIRIISHADLERVVNIHLMAFQGFFLSVLGHRFLVELYSGILEDTSGIFFLYECDNVVQGFVAGTDSPAGFYSRLVGQRWWRFALAAILPVLKRPSIIPRLLRAFSRGSAEDVHGNCATLMSIAVAPEAQGQGIGHALVQAFVREAARRGLAQVNLTTDKLDNDNTNYFYQRLGFMLHQTFTTPEGREMNEYVIDLM